MINMKGLPVDQLKQVLDALKEAANLGVEIQLKILQSLPSLVHNYGSYMYDELISELLLICSILQGHNKSGVVVNTASASMQQLILSVFEKVSTEDGNADTSEQPTVAVPIDNHGTIKVGPAAHDALRVFVDLCNITEKQKPTFLKFNHLPETFSLELFESILTYHSDMFHSHVELAYILRTRVAPMLLRSFAEKKDFPIMVRVTRVLYLLIRRQLSVLKVECEVILSVLTHALDPKGSPYWKRLLAMEVFQGTLSEFPLVQDIYREYDNESDRRDIIHDLLAVLEKISSENPEIIGRGSYSIPFTLPTGPDGEPVDLESPRPPIDLNKIPGISVRTSSVRVACIDLLDKSEPPALPESYLYYLILSCINSLSEGLAKFVFSSSSDGNDTLLLSGNLSETSLSTPQKTQQHYSKSSKSIVENESNTDTLKHSEDHNNNTDNLLTVASNLIEKSWPQLFSLYKTYFFSTMDTDTYHLLVRSAQKLTHVSGTLSIITPRNEFLSLLGKISIQLPEISDDDGSKSSSSKNLLSGVESFVGSLGSGLSGHHQKTPSSVSASGPPDSPSSSGAGNNNNNSSTPLVVKGTLTSRNILCCRALLNLGVYLGNSLGENWKIIIEALQSVDSILNFSESDQRRQSTSVTGGLRMFSHLGSDYASIDNSFKKMLDSTKEYSEESFVDLIISICSLSASIIGVNGNGNEEDNNNNDSNKKFWTLEKQLGVLMEKGDPLFLLDLLGELSQINITRFVSGKTSSGKDWDYLIQYLGDVILSRNVSTGPRIRATQILDEIDLQATLQTTILDMSKEWTSKQQRKILGSFRHSVGTIVQLGLPVEESVNIIATESEIHVSMIDNLTRILDQCGGRLVDGWDIILDIIDTVFNWSANKEDLRSSNPRVKNDRSGRLVKSGFESLQLICNDFLHSLPTTCLLKLIETLRQFCEQERDLNISFSAISFFWSVSDHIRSLLGDKYSVDLRGPITNQDKLLEEAESGIEPYNMHGLWIVSLLRLAAIAGNPRSEVRNGAVQILFRVFEAHGSKLTPNVWKTCHDVLFPSLMEVRPNINMSRESPESEEARQWTETMTLILNGFGTLYSNFMRIFIKQSYFIDLWTRLLDYYKKLTISNHSYVISLHVYRSLEAILKTFVKGKEEQTLVIPQQCLEETWEFWTKQPVVSENIMDAKVTQESLTALIELHIPLFKLSDSVTEDNNEKTIERFKQCGSFPVLAPYHADREHMSPLQAAVFSRVKEFNLQNTHVSSLILGLLSHFIRLPFEAGSNSNNTKSPTFISLGHTSLIFLRDNLNKIAGFKELYSNGTLSTLYSALLVPMEIKFNSPLISGRKKEKLNENVQLWQLAGKIFLILTNSVFSLLDQDSEIWGLILRGVVSVLSTTKGSSLEKDETYEQFDIDIYTSLMDVLQPHYRSIPSYFWENLVRQLFGYSMLYTTNRESYAQVKEPLDSVKGLCSNNFHGSSTSPKPLARQKIAYMCIDELARLEKGSSHDYLILRCALVLNQYISDKPLRGLSPTPKIQRSELTYILNILMNLEDIESIEKLNPLIARSVSVAVKDEPTLKLLQHLLIKIHE